MNEYARVLGEGTLTNAVGTMYECPLMTRTVIVAVNVANNNSAGTQTVVAYFRRSSDTALRRRYRQVVITASESSCVLGGEHPILMEGGDIIEGITTDNGGTDFLVMGREIRG